MAAACLAGDADPAPERRAVLALADRPVLRDLSLCHGELGIADALLVAADARQDDSARLALSHLAGLILGSVTSGARYCGTPAGIVTPGLINGLAGIGYGLLRLGFADQVPSVLALEPGAPAALSQ